MLYLMCLETEIQEGNWRGLLIGQVLSSQLDTLILMVLHNSNMWNGNSAFSLYEFVLCDLAKSPAWYTG